MLSQYRGSVDESGTLLSCTKPVAARIGWLHVSGFEVPEHHPAGLGTIRMALQWGKQVHAVVLLGLVLMQAASFVQGGLMDPF